MNYNDYFSNSEQKVSDISKLAVLKDGTGEFFFPVTCTAAIYDMDGITVSQKIEQIEKLAKTKEILLANDDAYDKSSLESYLQCLLNDPTIIDYAIIMFSAQASGFPDSELVYDVIVTKLDKALFVEAYNDNARSFATYKDNKLSTWEVNISEALNAPDSERYTKKAYVDEAIEEKGNLISNSINSNIASAVSTSKADILNQLQSVITTQNQNIASTYVTKTYMSTNLYETLQEAKKYTDGQLADFDLSKYATLVQVEAKISEVQHSIASIQDYINNEISTALENIDKRLSVNTLENLTEYSLNTPVGLHVFCKEDCKVYINEGTILNESGENVLKWTEYRPSIDEPGISAIIENVMSSYLSNKLGELNNLKTTDKSTIVGAINEVFQSGNSFKKKIQEAVIAKDNRVTLPDNPTIYDYTKAIDDIFNTDDPASYAKSGDIRKGKIAYANNIRIEGTFVDDGLKMARGTCNYSTGAYKKTTKTLNIPINVPFTPQYVFIRCDAYYSPGSAIYGMFYGWVSNLYSNTYAGVQSSGAKGPTVKISSYSSTAIGVTCGYNGGYSNYVNVFEWVVFGN